MERDLAFERVLVLRRQIGMGEIGQSSHREPHLRASNRADKSRISGLACRAPRLIATPATSNKQGPESAKTTCLVQVLGGSGKAVKCLRVLDEDTPANPGIGRPYRKQVE